MAQASDAKAEATGTASDELSEDDLEAVAEMTSRRSQGGKDVVTSTVKYAGAKDDLMTDKNQTEASPPAGSDEAKPEAAQAIGAKAEDTSTATASDELSGDDLEAVVGGYPLGWRGGAPPPPNTGNI